MPLDLVYEVMQVGPRASWSPASSGRELRREQLPAGTFGDLEQQEVLLAKTGVPGAVAAVGGVSGDKPAHSFHGEADAPAGCPSL